MEISKDVIIDTIKNFRKTDDLTIAIPNVLKKICEVCDINKVSIIAYNIKLDKYFKVYEYNLRDNLIDYTKNMNIDEYINLNFSNDYLLNQNHKKIIDLCNINSCNYIHTNCKLSNYLTVKDSLEATGFIFDNNNNNNSNNNKNNILNHEIYVSMSDYFPKLFSYCVFERENQDLMSDDQVDFLTILSDILNNFIKVIFDNLNHQNEISERDSINNLLVQKIPFALLDRTTHKVIYFTDLFFKEVPEIKIGKCFYDIERMKEYYNSKSNYQNILSDNKILRKTTHFKLASNRDAYLIYIESNANDVNKLDNLTQALLIKDFEEYYNAFIKANHYNYALCSLDIDKFKYINSMFGYDVGDAVLKKVSNVIRDFININETFCRIGEDKFSIFLSYDNDLQLYLKLTKLSKLFESMRDEHFPDAKITVVNGVTLVDKTLPLNTLLDQSTTARKNAKGSHKNKFSYYNVEWDLKLQREIEIEEQVPHAIAKDEFKVFLQPKFDLNTKKICGAEALVRWITPKGMIFPDQFIPLFERNGFIITLDFIVYEKVMQYIRTCLDDNLVVYPISVNVSRNHIKDEKFLEKFMNLVKKYDIPYKYLELEVTESIFIEDRVELKNFIDMIKGQNLKVSIDDFGTAYSSLQTLTNVNVDILKIDKGFLDNISSFESEAVSKDKILIKNIITLAKELDFTVICEGVETDEQIEFLKNIGCELGQGYVFARPMSIDDYNKQFIFE